MNELLAKILEKKAAAAGGVLVVTLLIAGGLFWYRGTGTPPAADEDWQNFASSDTTLETTDSFSGVAIKKYADIKGAVKHPGVYEVMTGERVIDLIEKAGGVTAEAATNQVNFAQLVEDQAVIFVPKEGEEPQLAAV